MTAEPDEAGFVALTDKIARERGFGAAHYKNSCVRRRIAVRMRARGAGDYRAYSALLDTDPAEYEHLIDALTINVTKLFRNAETWSVVEKTVLPALWSLPSPRLQCWVAGCASGEEAYTVAALWHRLAESRRETERLARVRIVATDIDRASLEAAERGEYGAESFVETPAAVRDRYFTAIARNAIPQHAAAPELRALVKFERRDMLQERPPLGPMHLITCRNVIIYFDRASQEALLRRFHESLVPGGFLVLGKVETVLGPSRALFEAVDSRQRIFRRT